MSPLNFAQPDVKLLLDEHGVIREASVGGSFTAEALESWIGCAWADTVADVGGDKVESMLATARRDGVSGFRQLNQRFPSGLELPIEYTTVWLGGPSAAAMAIGRNLQAVAELQSRLISVQEALERDYWKLREVETRYRQLFDASNEAVILVRADSLRVVEANPAALRALGLELQRPERVGDRDLMGEIPAAERDGFHTMLVRARDQGKAPGVLVHLGPRGEPWMVRASLIRSEGGPVFLLQLQTTGSRAVAADGPPSFGFEELVERAPDACAVLDRDGVIERANPAFVEMVQVGSESAVAGEHMERWLSRPTADLNVIIANVTRLGTVRQFPTTVRGELGSEVKVEISAFGNRDQDPDRIGMVLRDVGRRLAPSAEQSGLGAALGSLTRQIGNASMRSLVRNTVAVVEKHFIRTALELTGGNRTAAAELLGLSRQGLYAKLGRYGMDSETRDRPDTSE